MTESRPPILGIHHITAVAGQAQTNLDFYARVLGLRLVKRTVNFDDPGSYHLYYGDAAGTPGTVLTFFPWGSRPAGAALQAAAGQVSTVPFAVPRDSLGFWLDRLRAYGFQVTPSVRRGAPLLTFEDPDGIAVELVGAEDAGSAVAAWDDTGVPEEHAVRGFDAPRLVVAQTEPTVEVLTKVLGFRATGSEGDLLRFEAGSGGIGTQVDVMGRSDLADTHGGAGTIHHIAFRVASDEDQLAWRSHLVDLGFLVSPVMDRAYFRSIYFREPGGILFELATDGPGFAVDEAPDALGERLMLPSAASRRLLCDGVE